MIGSAASDFQEHKLDLAQKAEILDRGKWGREFNWDELEILAAYFQCFRVPEDQIIFREGDRLAYLGIIASGSVKICKASGRGKARRICDLKAGQAFGEMSLLDGYPRSATVTSLEEVRLLILSSQSFERMTTEKPQLVIKMMHKIARTVSDRLRRTNGVLIDYLDG